LAGHGEQRSQRVVGASVVAGVMVAVRGALARVMGPHGRPMDGRRGALTDILIRHRDGDGGTAASD
jgi:hypothetical protein